MKGKKQPEIELVEMEDAKEIHLFGKRMSLCTWKQLMSYLDRFPADIVVYAPEMYLLISSALAGGRYGRLILDHRPAGRAPV